ncbi:MAG: DUF2971 domain-containing protein [Proteobacteria bacterium]|nr:DUF2971 domain-containing protein [Pseudomonadota bacterium]
MSPDPNADAAMNMIRTREIWMRKSSCMNDFMEVRHGLNCVILAYESEQGAELKQALNDVFDGITADIEAHFNGWMPHIEHDTYIACFSEHDDAEDIIGRLSMWRAYGDGTGVAFVLKSAPFFNESDAFKAYTSPVAYISDKEFGREFTNAAGRIREAKDFLRQTYARNDVVAYVFEMLRFAALCTKHPGFAEEREWRIVYCPKYMKSDALVRDIQAIKGVPQPIYKIPLKNVPAEGLLGIEIPELLDRIIIGPSKYPAAAREAFVELLENAGVTDAQNKVFVSDIPLRR